jgi:pyridoxamine 5'-phosphate oxidase
MAQYIATDMTSLRVDYAKGELLEDRVAADPIEQFSRWFADAQAAQVIEPNAMTLCTVGADGMPSSRVVLLKVCDQRGFTFFTNYTSRKAGELAVHPIASLTFFWAPLERQVGVQGDVEKVSRAETDEYFQSRPLKSRLGAWVSRQSQVIASRAVLEAEMSQLESRYADGNIPTPDFWGGYRLKPRTIEFWQGRRSRLHDRLRYRRDADRWIIERLSP